LSRPDRQSGPVSKVVGLYLSAMRRTFEHFFPESLLEIHGDHSIIDRDVVMGESSYRLIEDPDRLAIDLEWRGSRMTFRPGSPVPLYPAERRMIGVIVSILDQRFRSRFEQDIADRFERFNYLTEDLIVADYLDPEGAFRFAAALEALRVAALSTYENKRVTTGALLLGTPHDPTTPGREELQGAPQFNARLSAIKGFHRLCDGVRTVFVVDPRGEMVRIADVADWAERTQPKSREAHLCPRRYRAHARSTISGGHVCLVLTPSREIKVFARGELTFNFSDGRWRLLDVSTKFAAWSEAVRREGDCDLARRLFQAALNLSEARVGALLVVARDPERAIPQLIAPIDRMTEEVAVDDPQDPENLSPRLAKRALHHVVRGMSIEELEPTVLEAIASLDGAVVAAPDGRLLTFGAILRINPEVLDLGRSVQGARTLAALAASQFGPVLKVSEDGYVTMFLKGRRVWEF
jgi:DNA integrity scanning protein DisA with diadenylate cyclase activity